MDVNIIQALLVFVVGFIMGIDQFSFLESLYQPIVTCPIIGAILGNFELGIVVGGAYQLIQIGSMPIGGAQPPNAILGGIMATIFAVSLDMEATADGVGAAMGLAIPFAVFGQYAVTLTFTFMSGMMAKADKYAEEANVKGIRNINFLEMAVLGCLFGVLAVAGLYGGTALGETLKDFSYQFSWVMAGFAMALICAANASTAGATLLLCAFVGAAIAIYDFTTQTKIKQNAGAGAGFVGGDQDGI